MIVVVWVEADSAIVVRCILSNPGKDCGFASSSDEFGFSSSN